MTSIAACDAQLECRLEFLEVFDPDGLFQRLKIGLLETLQRPGSFRPGRFADFLDQLKEARGIGNAPDTGGIRGTSRRKPMTLTNNSMRNSARLTSIGWTLGREYLAFRRFIGVPRKQMRPRISHKR